MKLLPIALMVLVGCSSSPTQPPSASSGWTNFGVNGKTTQLSNPFNFDQVIGYVYTAPPGALAPNRTFQLNYSITGSINLTPHDPKDILPPRMHFFIWEKGDNLSGMNGYQYYRWWCPQGAVLRVGNNQSMSCLLSTNWTDVNGQPATQVIDGQTPGMAGFAQALNNPFAIGFTFGGAEFYGHGLSGPGTIFAVDTFTVK